MPTRRRQTAARRPSAPIRRRRVWARENHTFLDLGAAVSIQSLTTDYRADRGIVKMDPGTTIGGIRGRITVVPGTSPAAATADSLLWGIIVAPDTVDSVDIDPAFLHLDWMAYGRFAWGPFVAASGLGYPLHDELSVRAMRKLDEIGHDVFMAVGASAAGTVDLVVTTSVLLLLP